MVILQGMALTVMLHGDRVRISLGLKPLSTENEADQRRKEAQEREAKRAEEAKQAQAAELAERVKSCVPSSVHLPPCAAPRLWRARQLGVRASHTRGVQAAREAGGG